MNNAQQYLARLITLNDEAKIEQLEQEIAYLFHHQFERLLWILYRLDVQERKLTIALKEGNQPEEKIITQLLLERCAQILACREGTSAKSTANWSFDLEEE